MNNNYATIIIPTRNEEKYIDDLINSIVNQDYDKAQFEVIIADGLSTDSTIDIIKNYSNKYPFIRLIDNPHKTVPYALNLGIKHAIGDIIIRMDAHVIYPSNYVSTLVYYLQKLNANNVGALMETLPGSDTKVAKSIAISLSSIFGVGNATFRLNKKVSEEFIPVDTVPFGCYRKEVFSRIGLFDEQLTRNQDNEFNERLLKAGGKIYLIPSLRIKYYARETYSKLYRMFFQYGYFGPLVDLKLKRPTRLRRYIPTLFVLALVAVPLAGLLVPLFFHLWLFVVLLYVVAAFSFAAYECVKRSQIVLVPFVMWAYFTSHISYGLGYLSGFIDFVVRRLHLKKKVDVEISR